jgi:hypothetical protein
MVRATLADFEAREAELRECLEWFRTLPFYLDLGDLRVVHAEWNDELVACVNGCAYLGDDFLRLATTKGARIHRTIEILLKGSEVPLPSGVTTTDLDGTERNEVRVCWPLPAAGRTYRDIAFPSGPHIPDEPVPASVAHAVPGYGLNEPPVLFGHYAIKGHRSGLIVPNAACLDFGCGKGGPLTAYRWSGERTLSAGNFVSA